MASRRVLSKIGCSRAAFGLTFLIFAATPVPSFYRPQVLKVGLPDAAGRRILASTALPDGGIAVGGENRAFIARLDRGGNQIYRLQAGREEPDAITGLAADAAGNVYAVGRLTTGAGERGFLLKVGRSGERLEYLEFSSAPRAIVADAEGLVYLATGSHVDQMRVVDGSWRATAAFDAAGAIEALSLDAAGSVYAGGSRSSGGGTQAYVAKLVPSGKSWEYILDLPGSSGQDAATTVTVDASGALYVAGTTSSFDFPVRSAAQPHLSGSSDAFVARIAPDGSGTQWATYLGGSGADYASAIAPMPDGSVAVIGWTASGDFPGAVRWGVRGGEDGFLSIFDAAGRLVSSEYIGSAGQDRLTIAVLASDGQLWLAGWTRAGATEAFLGRYSLAAGVRKTEDARGTIAPLAFAPVRAAAATTTSLATSPNPSLTAQSVTLTATVSPTAATGVVTFYDSSTVIGTAVLAGGQAIFKTSLLAPGTHSLRAAYGGDGSAYDASSSPVQTHVVSGAVLGNFGPPLKFLFTTSADHVYSVDFTRDGIPDFGVLWSTWSGYQVTQVTFRVYPGVGDGTFRTGIDTTVAMPVTGRPLIGDFDGDGSPDIAIRADSDAIGGSTLVRVLFGNGDGSFQPAQNAGSLPFESFPQVGDFDGDGRSDIAGSGNWGAIGESAFTGIRFLWGRSDRTFDQSALTMATTAATGAPITAADFNADGRTDIAFSSSGKILIFPGTGPRTFGAPLEHTSSGAPLAMIVADFNGDSKPDLGVGRTTGVGVLLGNGDGTFQNLIEKAIDLGPNESGAWRLMASDVDADGKPDILALPREGLSIRVLLNNGSGSLRLAGEVVVREPATGNPPSVLDFAAADFNRDGKLDIALTTYGSEGAYAGVLLGIATPSTALTVSSPTSTVGQAVTLTATVSPATTPGIVTFYDGSQVLGSATLSGGQAVFMTRSLIPGVHTLRAAYSGHLAGAATALSPSVSHTVTAGAASALAAGTSLITSTTPYRIATGDFNGDGKADLVLTYSDTFGIWLGNGNGTFQPEVLFSVGGGGAGANGGIVPADLNQDGKLDLLVHRYGFRGRGDGTFEWGFHGFGGLYVGLGDFNRDGKIDQVKSDGSQLSVTLGYGNGQPQPAPCFVANLVSKRLVTGDFNSDGVPDVAAVDETGNRLVILLGNADATLQNPVVYTTPAGPAALAIGDFDGDGKQDLVTSNATAGSLSVFRGRGDGTFFSAVNYPVGGAPSTVVAVDLNGDGRVDLAAVNPTALGVHVLSGNGDGTFGAARYYYTGQTPKDLTAADFNGDGRMDLAVTVSIQNKVVLLLGVLPASSTTSLSVSSPTSTLGQQVTLTATVSPNTASGKVLFSDNGSPLGVVAVSGGQAVLRSSLLSAGSHSFRATYSGDEFNHKSSLSTAVSHRVSANPIYTFGSASNYSAGPYVTKVATGDFNGDGRLDVVVFDSFYRKFNVLMGQPDGTFTLGPEFPGGEGLNLAVADLNWDGKADLLLSGQLALGQGDGTFASPAWYQYPRMSLPITGDFNGDGKPDVAAIDSSTRQLGVLISNGDGTPQPPLTVNATLSQPTWLAAGEFNGDGKADLVVSDGTDRSISVFLSNGDGTFLAPQKYSVGARPSHIVVSDLNADGKQDLAVSDANTNRISILMGRGDGQFENEGDAIAVTTSSWIEAGDFNGDGKIDLLVAHEADGTVSLLAGNGDGTFQTAVTHAGGDGPVALVVGDFNGDGKPDYATLGAGGMTVFLAVEPSSVTVSSSVNPAALNQEVTLTAAVHPSSATGTVAFFDGVVALGTAGLSGGQATLKTRWQSSGNRQLRANYRGDPLRYAASVSQGVTQSVVAAASTGFSTATSWDVGKGPQGIAVGDFNGDGKQDLATANASNNTVSVLLNNGDGTFAPRVNYNVGSAPQSIVAADFNGDRKVDLATANFGSDNISVLLGIGNGTFQNSIASSGPHAPQSLALCDENRDGIPDLVVSSASDTWRDHQVLRGRGDGTFVGGASLYTGTGSLSVAAGDFNGDGRTDVAMSWPSGGVAVRLGLENGTFSNVVTYPTGSTPRSVTVGDFNGDGKLDLAVANNGSMNVSVLLGDGNGTFQAALQNALSVAPGWLTATDCNGDGRLDLVVIAAAANSVLVLHGNGDGSFSPPVSYATGGTPSSAAIGDFNGDGRTDVAVVNSADNTVHVFLGVAPSATLAITKTHTGNFTRSQTGATYTITVRNLGSLATSGTVSVVDTLPAGLTATAIAGSGWSCTLATLTCTRSDSLAAGGSYPPITLTVNVSGTAPASVINTVTVSGGGAAQPATAQDPTSITAGTPYKISVAGAAYWIQDADGNFTWDGSPPDRMTYWGSAQPGEVLVFGDWNGDGKTEIGLYWNGLWMLDYNGNGVWDAADKLFYFGSAGFAPVVGNWNGAGGTKVGVYKDGLWILDYNGNFAWDGTGTDKMFYFGAPGDTPVVGDWNGSLSAKVGIYKDGLWILDYNGNFTWDGLGTDKMFYFGAPGYTPLVGDWNGDGKTKIGGYVDGLWVLDHNGNFTWDGAGTDVMVYFGEPGYVPVIGDWNGDGTAKIGGYKEGLWVLDYNGNRAWDGTDKLVYFGAAGHSPVVGKW